MYRHQGFFRKTLDPTVFGMQEVGGIAFELPRILHNAIDSRAKRTSNALKMNDETMSIE